VFIEAEGAADPQTAQLVSLAELVDQGSADAKARRNLTDRHEAFVRSGIWQKFVHHRRTKRRLTISTWCHRIRVGGRRGSLFFHGLRTDAARGDPMEFLRGGFGTRGSQVQILSPRPIRKSRESLRLALALLGQSSCLRC